MQIWFHNFRFGVLSLALLTCCCLASISYAEGNTKDTIPTASVIDVAIQQQLADATKASDVKSVGELAQAVLEQY